MRLRFFIFALCLCAVPVAAQDDPHDRPIDVGLEEEVDVRLVLVDFLVLDKDDRTVPDLTIDDFLLKVDGKRVEIASLDLDCPMGAAGEPRSATRKRPATPIESESTRRMVLVFDYDHISNVAETYDRVYEMLEVWIAEGYEHMVVSMGDVIRIESPFTQDLDELHWALRRMKNDRDLYGRNNLGTTGERFFDRTKALFDILERWEGRKAVVLFSGPFVPDGFFRDPQFEELSAMAAAARTVIYPVDSAGLRAGRSPIGGPPVLRRLATETGGRVTSGTNDVTLAYARAQRDIGCTYTIAFYDPGRRADSNRRLSIRLRHKRSGTRVVYPDFYVRRSPEKKKESVVKTAAMAPHIFESDRIRAEYFVMEADRPASWRMLVGVDLRLGTSSLLEQPQTWRLQGFLRRLNGTVVRKFEREMEVPATDPATGITPPVKLFHELFAPPGEYALSVVVTVPDEDDPIAATRLASLAETPYQGSFVLGPILGVSNGANDDFEPLLEPRVVPGRTLEALSVLCVTGSGGKRDVPEMARWVSTADGNEVHRYEVAPLSMKSRGGVRCGRVIDAVATETLAPGRYKIQALARSPAFTTEARTTEFVVDEGSPQ